MFPSPSVRSGYAEGRLGCQSASRSPLSPLADLSEVGSWETTPNVCSREDADDRFRPIADICRRAVASRIGDIDQDEPMRLSSALNPLPRLVQMLVCGWAILSIVNQFRTEGWRSGLTHFLIVLLGSALVIAVVEWARRLPEPEPQDWTKE